MEIVYWIVGFIVAAILFRILRRMLSEDQGRKKPGGSHTGSPADIRKTEPPANVRKPVDVGKPISVTIRDGVAIVSPASPVQPAMPAAQFTDLQSRMAATRLPATILSPAADLPFRTDGTRLGGPVWLADGDDLPVGKDGQQLEFIAQVNFAELPPIPDFPDAGLMQLFVGRDDLYGANFDDPMQQDIAVRWHPNGAHGGRVETQTPLPDYRSLPVNTYAFCSPFERDTREQAIMLRGVSVTAGPNSIDSTAEKVLASAGITGWPEFSDRQYDELFASPMRHHVGGHPAFTQNDFRGPGGIPPYDGSPSPYADYDRVLLRITSAEGIMWGDVGEANLLIRRDDLLARDFSRVVWWWDCH